MFTPVADSPSGEANLPRQAAQLRSERLRLEVKARISWHERRNRIRIYPDRSLDDVSSSALVTLREDAGSTLDTRVLIVDDSEVNP